MGNHKHWPIFFLMNMNALLAGACSQMASNHKENSFTARNGSNAQKSQFRSGSDRASGYESKDDFLNNSVFFRSENIEVQAGQENADTSILPSAPEDKDYIINIQERKSKISIEVVRVCSMYRSAQNGDKNFHTISDDLSMLLIPEDKISAAGFSGYRGSDGKMNAALFSDSIHYAVTSEMKASLINEGRMETMINVIPDGRYIVDFCSPTDSRCLGYFASDVQQVAGVTQDNQRITIKNGLVDGAVSLKAGLLFDYNRGGESGCDKRASPLMIDFYNTGISLTAPLNGVEFDVDVDGERDIISWVDSDGSGILALDINGNGTIDDGGELFGDHSINPQGGTSPANGFEALGNYDQNRDGWIDAKDPVFVKLKIWIDRNRNGISENSELYTMTQKGIVAFDLSYREMNQLDRFGNATKQRSIVKLNTGELRMIFDIWFRKAFRVKGV